MDNLWLWLKAAAIVTVIIDVLVIMAGCNTYDRFHGRG